MSSEPARTFVSYSHDDAALVTPVVRLLRVQNPDVFQDVDSIRPGKKWRSEIEAAITGATLLIVFWCRHAKESTEVEAEWRAALRLEKDLLPILLDATPLADELADYEWINFQGLAGAGHRHKEPSPSTAQISKDNSDYSTTIDKQRSPSRYRLAAAAAGVSVGVALMLWLPTDSTTPGGGGPFEVAANFPAVWMIAGLAAGFSVWWLLKRMHMAPPPPPPVVRQPAPQTGAVQDVTSQMAEQIKSEVLRRLT